MQSKATFTFSKWSNQYHRHETSCHRVYSGQCQQPQSLDKVLGVPCPYLVWHLLKNGFSPLRLEMDDCIHTRHDSGCVCSTILLGSLTPLLVLKSQVTMSGLQPLTTEGSLQNIAYSYKDWTLPWKTDFSPVKPQMKPWPWLITWLQPYAALCRELG